MTHPASKANAAPTQRASSAAWNLWLNREFVHGGWRGGGGNKQHVEACKDTLTRFCCRVVFLPCRSTVGMFDAFMTDSGSVAAGWPLWWLPHFLWDSSLSHPMCFSANEQLGGHVHNGQQGLSDFSYKGVEHKQRRLPFRLNAGESDMGGKALSVLRMDLPGHFLLPPLLSTAAPKHVYVCLLRTQTENIVHKRWVPAYEVHQSRVSVGNIDPFPYWFVLAFDRKMDEFSTLYHSKKQTSPLQVEETSADGALNKLSWLISVCFVSKLSYPQFISDWWRQDHFCPVEEDK